MGKFAGFGRHLTAIGDGTKPAESTALSRERAHIEQRARSLSADGGPTGFGKPSRIAIALDATGSMAGLIDDAKRAIAEILRRTAREAGHPVEIELFVYRDYDTATVVSRSGATADQNKLVAWLHTIKATGGGANDGEAVEAALALILPEQFACVLLAGDEPSNSRANLRAAGHAQAQSAEEISILLGKAKVPIHSFVVGGYAPTLTDFAKLSRLSGGKSGRLDGSREMIDLAVMAILSSLVDTAAVRRYSDSISLTDNTRAFATALLTAPR